MDKVLIGKHGGTVALDPSLRRLTLSTRFLGV